MTNEASRQPQVSVITIFFNAEKYIAEAIESVFAQSYPDWELILVDDGSTDRGGEIAQRYAAERPDRVRYLQHDGGINRGMSASRNLGLADARGEFVAFLDADDVWLPHKLQYQLGLLQENPGVGVVYGPTLFWYSWTGKPRDARKDNYGNTGFTAETVVHPPEMLTLSLRTEGGIMPGICSLLVRRRVLEAVGGFEDAFKGCYEDQVFLAKLFAGTPILITNRCSDRYRQHPESHCAQAIKNGEYNPDLPHPARERYLHWLDEFVRQQHIETPEMRAELDRSLAVYRHPRRHRAWLVLKRAAWRPVRISLKVAKRVTPKRFRSWLRGSVVEGHVIPPVGMVRFGSLRRLAPISRDYGYDRGQPIDRYYIEKYLARHADDVRGRVLEVGEQTYTVRFGGERVESRDVLHVQEGHPDATIVADLAHADEIPSNSFDCIIVAQTLQLIYDVRAAARTLHRILRPGGVVLATFPGLTQISSADWGETWYWGFTTASATRLFRELFPADNVVVESWGNVLSTTAFLQGLASRELRTEELEYRDADYQLLLTVSARKPDE